MAYPINENTIKVVAIVGIVLITVGVIWAQPADTTIAVITISILATLVGVTNSPREG